MVLGKLRAKAEAHFRVRFADAGHQRVELALGDSEALQDPRAQDRVAGRLHHPRDHHLVDDAVVLARHAGKEEELAAIDAQRECRRASVGIAEHLRGLRHFRLAQVVLRHLLVRADLRPALLQVQQPRLVRAHRDAGRLRGARGREVV